MPAIAQIPLSISLFFTALTNADTTIIASIVYVIAAVVILVLYLIIRFKLMQLKVIEVVEDKEKITQLLVSKEQSFADIAHELRTPLVLMLDLLATHFSLLTDKRSTVTSGLTRANGRRLLAMIEQMMDIAHSTSTESQVMEPVAVLPVCQFLVECYQPFAVQRNIRLNLDVTPAITADITVLLLPDSLEKILTNLLTNAFRYSDDHQSITLTIDVEDLQRVVIGVKDTGKGIIEAEQGIIFERFTQLDSGLSSNPGIGLGLALVKSLVELHQGKITVCSELNKGSYFQVWLPIENKSMSHCLVNKTLKAIEAKNQGDIIQPQQTTVERFYQVLESNYQDSNFAVANFAQQMLVSRRQLCRKTRSLVNLTPGEAIRQYRLKKAALKLAKGILPAVVAYEVGFTSHSYFSRCFKSEYRCLPCNYKQSADSRDLGTNT